MNDINLTEIKKLRSLLVKAGIPHTFSPLYDGAQIRLYADSQLIHQLDDAVIHSGSHGVQGGLLETFCLSDCEGWETAEQIFEGWKKMYEEAVNGG